MALEVAISCEGVEIGEGRLCFSVGVLSAVWWRSHIRGFPLHLVGSKVKENQKKYSGKRVA